MEVLEKSLVGYVLPTLEGYETYTGTNTEEYCRLVKEKGLSTDLGLEMYSPETLSQGELEDVKENIVSQFGSQALAYDVTDKVGYLPAVGDAISAMIFGGMALATSNVLWGLFAVKNVFHTYSDVKNLNQARSRKPFAEDVALNLDVYQGTNDYFISKLDDLYTAFENAHGSEAEIYHTMMEKSEELDLPEVATFYQGKYEIEARLKKTGWEKVQQAAGGVKKAIKNFFTSTKTEDFVSPSPEPTGAELPETMVTTMNQMMTKKGKEVQMRLVDRDLEHTRSDKGRNVRDIPAYVIPTKDGFEVYADEKFDMFYLMSAKDDINVRINLRTPENFSQDKIDLIADKLEDHIYDTIYKSNKLDLLQQEAQYSKGGLFGRIVSDGFGGYMLASGSGLLGGTPSPFKIGFGAYLIARSEFIARETNKRMSEHLKGLVSGVDEFHERIGDIVISEHKGLTRVNEIMETFDDAEDAYTQVFHEVNSLGLNRFEKIFYTKALSEQWDLKSPGGPIITIGRDE